MVECGAISAFTAQYLGVRDRVTVGVLISIGLVPLFLHRPVHAATALVN